MSQITKSHDEVIAELEAMLAAAKRAKSAERDALRQSVTPVYAYSVEWVTERSHHEIFDPTCVLVKISGKCVNAEEAQSVGHHLHEGSMVYLFNKATGQIVTSVGGGSIFISGRGFSSSSPEVLDTMRKVSAFLVAHPDGGDITSIVEAHKALVGR